MKSKLSRLGAAALSSLMILSLGANSIALAGDPIDEMVRQAQQEAAKKKPLPAARYIFNREYDLRHVALDLRFDWDKAQTFGTASLTFAPLLANTRTVNFDAASMQINSVKLQNGAPLKFDYDEPKQKLAVELDRGYNLNDQITVVIDYRTKKTYEAEGGIPGFGGGLKFIKPRTNESNRPRQIWSQGESEYNRYWFPSYDHPNDFRTTEIRATVEKPFTVISNGKLLETKENSDNTRTFHWRIEKPHTNYLTSVIVGEYAAIEGSYDNIPVVSYVYPNEVAEGRATTKALPEMVRHFSEKTGVKYPFEKYVQTMVRDMNGAMENITATTMTDTIIKDERALLDEDSDGIQAHELAHQWFGDTVTCRDWSDIWLNESFATYMEVVWTEKSKGRDEALFGNKANQDAYLATWRQGTRRPIVTKNYGSPDAVFDAYAYPRGGAVLHMLRTQLGDEAFWRAINYYLNKHKHSPVSTEQFRIALEESTGQSFDVFFDQWLYKMGHPVFEVTKNYDPNAKTLTMTVKQTQKLDETSEYPQVEFFDLPVEVEIATANNSRIEKIRVEPKAENVYTFAVDAAPTFVDFDNGGTLIKELKFERTTDELPAQLRGDADVIGRAAALSELKIRLNAAAATDADKTKILAAINQIIANERFRRIRTSAIGAVTPAQPEGPAAIFAAISGTTPKANYSLETATALQTAAKDADSRVRAAAIRALGIAADANKYNALFAQALNDRSYSVIEAAATSLGATKSPDAYAQLVKLLDQPSFKDRVLVAGLTGLAATKDKRALETGFKYSGAAYNPTVRGAALGVLADAGKGDSRVFPLLFESYKRALETNDYQNIFGGFVAFIKLGDPRGQEAFDLAKEKFKTSPQFMGFVTTLEGAFKQSAGK